MRSHVLKRVGVVAPENSSPVEADAESIRAAILLDELESSVPAGQGGGGRIIVEVKTLNALAVLQYSCSIRVMALHTGEMNARRSKTPLLHFCAGSTNFLDWL